MSFRKRVRRYVGVEDFILLVAATMLGVSITTGAMFAAWVAIGLAIAECLVILWWFCGVSAR